MKQAIDAVYENGSFRPVQHGAIALSNGQRVKITIDDENEPEALKLATDVYAGLSEDEIDDIEQIALDRGHFFGETEAQ
jgi:predicted DNA-binding antitoxin AbrB/MazE fold protein